MWASKVRDYWQRCKRGLDPLLRLLPIDSAVTSDAHKSSDPKQESLDLGKQGERLAARYLKQLGYRILERGHRQKLGEIDLIAVDGTYLVFVEVKTWLFSAGRDPSEAVDRRKQERLTRAALIYLKAKGLLDQPARFDVVSIVWHPEDGNQPRIRHFINAFEAVGRGL